MCMAGGEKAKEEERNEEDREAENSSKQQLPFLVKVPSHTVDTKVPLPLWNRKKAQNTSRLHFPTHKTHLMDNSQMATDPKRNAVSLWF